MGNNNIQDKSFQFAIRIVNLCKQLRLERHEYILSNQLMKSGTSIGANVSEAQNAQSRADFLSKLNIALKEASESKYWIRLIHATEYLSEQEFLYNWILYKKRAKSECHAVNIGTHYKRWRQ